MSKLTVETYTDEKFGDLRFVMIDDNPWFFSVDLVRILGYKYGSADVKNKVDEKDRVTIKRKEHPEIFSGSINKYIIVNTTGVGALIKFSRSPIKNEFKEWLCNRGVAVTIPVDQNEPEITFDLPEEAMRVFQNEKFGEVRTCMVNGEAMFCGVDVAKILGYENPNMAVQKHVDVGDRIVLTKNENIQNGYFNFSNRGDTFINESGLFSLILGSKLESAKEFKHWITSEVLPSIYKYGMYATKSTLEQVMEDPNYIVLLANQILKDSEEKKRLNALLDEAKPKVEYYDTYIDKTELINFRDLSKELRINERKMIAYLICDRYLYRTDSGELRPYAQYANKDEGALFYLRDFKNRNSGHVGKQTLVTPHGKEVLAPRILEYKEAISDVV